MNMKTEFQCNIIAKLKSRREELGFSQASIALYLGISPGQLGNIESYKRPHKYTLKQLVLLCKKLDIDITTLFINEDKRSENLNTLIGQIIRYEENEE